MSDRATVGPARAGLDEERQQILDDLERVRAKYEPLRKKSEQASNAMMRVYYEIEDLERRLAVINQAIEILG